jgi:hypothetical protein
VGVTYNAFLNRMELTKFMAIPRYAYMVLKMLGTHDVISLRGDVNHAYDCDKESCETADRLAASAELQELKKALSKSPWTRSCPRPRHPRCPSNQRTHSSKWSRYLWMSPSRSLMWGIVWIPNRNSCSSNSSRKIETSLHASLLTFLELLGSW